MIQALQNMWKKIRPNNPNPTSEHCQINKSVYVICRHTHINQRYIEIDILVGGKVIRITIHKKIKYCFKYREILAITNNTIGEFDTHLDSVQIHDITQFISEYYKIMEKENGRNGIIMQ